MSATIVFPRIKVQARLNGHTLSPTLILAMLSSSTPKKRKGKKKNDSSPSTTITLDEVIEIPYWNFNNLTCEHIIILQDILARKKQQEEMGRE